MKTTFKKIFDDFDDDIIDLNENSIYEDLGISGNDIKESVFSTLGIRHKKRRFGKCFTAVAAAAVLLTVGAIGTTAIYAGGGMQIVFEEFFGGNMNSAGLYDGGKVSFTTSDRNLNVEMLGVTGDDEGVYAILQAVKKDGTAFTDDGYENPSLSFDRAGIDKKKNSDGTIDLDFGEYYWDYNGCTVKCTDRNGFSLGSAQIGGGYDIKYFLNDDRTVLKIFISVSTDGLDARDGKLEVKSTDFEARKITRHLARYNNKDAEDWKEAEKLCEKLGIDIDECSWLYNGEYFDLCMTEKKVFKLPFEMSFTMNYRNNNNIKKILTKDDLSKMNVSEPQKVDMTISSFGVYLFADGNGMVCFGEEFVSKESKIILKDGREYYLYIRSGSSSCQNDTGACYSSFGLGYSEIPNPPDMLETVLVDTREVKSVIINGAVVYKK